MTTPPAAGGMPIRRPGTGTHLSTDSTGRALYVPPTTIAACRRIHGSAADCGSIVAAARDTLARHGCRHDPTTGAVTCRPVNPKSQH